MSKTDVQSIMGEPYKLEFELKDDEELEEKIYIKPWSGIKHGRL